MEKDAMRFYFLQDWESKKGKKYFWLGLCKVEERNGLLKDAKNTLGSGLNSTVDFHTLILFAE